MGDLAADDALLARRYPGERPERQPVHVLYQGAHLFRADVASVCGRAALDAMAAHAPDFTTLARVVGLPGADRLPRDAERIAALSREIEVDPSLARRADAEAWLAWTVHRRVLERLEREPVEDHRLDFEDGYGVRPDPEEDETARSAAQEVARGAREGVLPRAIGIRVKPANAEFRARSVRTLELFVGTLASELGGTLPPGFTVTLPKVTMPSQAGFFADALESLESSLGLANGSLRFEFMVETPQAVIGADGRSPIPAIVDAARGRAVAAHIGTYDYTAGVGVAAAHQGMRHPACDFLRHVLQVSLAGTGIWLCDGSTAVLPVGRHRAVDAPLAEWQEAENRADVHRGWRIHYDDVRNSLVRGWYQGWDLHPAQLVTRYAAVFAFYLEGLDAAAARLRGLVDRAARAALAGAVFDDAATGQALLNYVLRATDAGAVPAAEVLAATGLSDLEVRSFREVLARRAG